jgi:hypothetical protein
MPRGVPFGPGNRANPGGRPKALRDIEAMLDAEHRTVGNLRDVFARLKALALGEVVEVPVPGGEGETRVELRADPRFMDLYLNRVLGPVKELKIDLADAPDEVVAYLAEKLH